LTDIEASLAQERLQTPATEVVRGRSTLRCKSNRTIIRRMGDGEQRQSQLLRGVLDLCLLAVIEEQPAYGYEMTKRLRERGLFIVGEGSIYPLLGRLERDGLVQTHRAPSDGGPPRKYYRTSGKGQRALARGVAEWRAVRDAVDGVLRPIEVEVKR
jgi:PadR family transcriptional regulator PadR